MSEYRIDFAEENIGCTLKSCTATNIQLPSGALLVVMPSDADHFIPQAMADGLTDILHMDSSLAPILQVFDGVTKRVELTFSDSELISMRRDEQTSVRSQLELICASCAYLGLAVVSYRDEVNCQYKVVISHE